MEKRFDTYKKSITHDNRNRFCCDYKPSDITDNKEDLTLIWLDKSINDSTDFPMIFNKVHELIDYILLYTNLQSFLDCIQSVQNENVFLIVSHEMTEETLSSIYTMDIITFVFIYSIDNTSCTINLNPYKNNVIICNDLDSFMAAIQKNVYLFSKQTVSFSLFHNTDQSSFRDLTHNPASFLWFRLLLDVYKQLPQTTDAKNEMTEVCKRYYRDNDSYIKQINEFFNSYQESNVVYWYTKSGFIYRLINKAFRIDDILLLYLFRFYIIDLCKQLEIISKDSFQSTTTTTRIIRLYRGRPVHEEELRILQANIGQLISPNGFFSTTIDRDVALLFAGENLDRKKSTIFEITLDRSKLAAGAVVAADIMKLSNFPDEKEILFSVGSTFRIDNIECNSELQKWSVQMTATDDGLTYIQEHLNSMRVDLKETNSTRLFGKLLIDMGQYSKAEQYYNFTLKKISQTHEDFPSLYHGLGYINYVRDQFYEAVRYDKIAYEVRKQTLPENHLDIARSSLNLGSDYAQCGEYKKAEELLMEALRIRILNYGEKDHINIAIVLRVIGENYIYLDEYEKAYEYLMKALKMFMHIYTTDHAHLAGTLVKLGYFYEKQRIYNCALKYYYSAYRMATKIMLPEHPRLQKYFENIIKLYQTMNCYREAILFCEEKLSRQQQILGSQHPTIERFHEILRNLSDEIQSNHDYIEYIYQ